MGAGRTGLWKGEGPLFRSLWKTLAEEISGPAAAQAVAHIARHHRIQASPGYRQAAQWVRAQLVEAGLQARVLSFPADEATSFWTSCSFKEWDAREAALHLVEPAAEACKLADYHERPLNLVARSLSFDGEAEVVVLDKGTDPAEYDGLDVGGKVVLARGNVQRVHDLAVARRGALGLIYDGMKELEPVRPAGSLPDAVQYVSFWWQGQRPQGFGFALTPRQGERLRALAQEHTLRVRAHVDARLYAGALEVVEATIPGTTDEEVVLVAHLCHPLPSANDNGSGVAALMEAARAVQALIARGELDPPRRTLRFIWPPEMTGTFAYLSSLEERIPRMVAGLNLDMVGEDQDQCATSLLFEQSPGAFPSFAPVLLTRLREQLLPGVKSLSGTGGFPLFRFADVPFAAGSDHYIFSDPSVGVPMPMLNQWPDRFYHTSADTPDRTDAGMLHRAACIAAAYAYWLAQAGDAEARWLAQEMSARFRQQVIADAQDAVTCAGEENGSSREALRRQVEWRVRQHHAALQTVQRLAPIGVSGWKASDEEFASREWARVVDALPDRPPPDEAQGAATTLVPNRRFRGPVQVGCFVAKREEAVRDRWWDLRRRLNDVCGTLSILAEYWVDGQRDVNELARLVARETGQDATALLMEYFSFLAELGLMDVRSDGAGWYIIALDWSGAADERSQRRKIWRCLARSEEDRLRVVGLESRMTRREVVAQLVETVGEGERLLVGLDFAFSLPHGYVAQLGDSPAESWEDVVAWCTEEGEEVLTECPPPFWGRARTRKPSAGELPRFGLGSLWRKVERAAAPAKSVFQISGPGAVGSGALRGIPLLAQLREAGFAVWPFDRPAEGQSAVVEIYPRLFARAVRKSSARERRDHLAALVAQGDVLVPEEAIEQAASNDDAFDALVSVAGMWRALRAGGFGRYGDEFYVDPAVRTEGWIWGLGPDGESLVG
jgi:aminopeptidase YwaD